MRARQPLPRLWLMTDERQGDRLWRALEGLPEGAGVVFRHYGLAKGERRQLFDWVSAVCRERDLLLLLGGSAKLAMEWCAEGSHGRGRSHRSGGLRSAPAHNRAELRAAHRSGADFVFLSPVFSTRSHPNARPLGPLGFSVLARRSDLPVIALGGMDSGRWRSVSRYAYGWAAIDAWSG